LIDNGDIVAIVEEERFTRQKHAPNTFPEQSIQYVLESGGMKMTDVDSIAIGRDPNRTVENESLEGFKEKLRHFLINIGSKYLTPDTSYRDSIRKKVSEAVTNTPLPENLQFISHHRSHAASAAYCSPFEGAPTLTIDAQGEDESTVFWDSDLNRLKSFSAPNSVGYFYSIGTQYLGYRHGWDAGKVMGLAPYGNERDDFNELFDQLVYSAPGEYDVRAITEADDPIGLLENHFGTRRTYPEEFESYHKDFAYHLQKKTEEIAKNLVRGLLRETNRQHLSMAGGIAMNCKMNREIRHLDEVDNIWIQPAANDSGICLGAGLAGYADRSGSEPNVNFDHVYYGPKYSDDDVVSHLDDYKLNYQELDHICRRVAELLADGAIIGWFQGQMEFGPRALGNRSILADPRSQESMDAVNANVKKRQSWRPFAPSILEEAREEYLVDGNIAPFMILLDEVKKDRRTEIPAVTHKNGTTRPQTVSRSTNERYWRLIKEFESITGTPVLLNTSFNKTGEPIVTTPEDAIRTFYATGLDYLAIGNYLLAKHNDD
jgi:carbamoyltransferase